MVNSLRKFMHFDIFVKHMLRTIKLCSSDLETDLKFFMKIDKYIFYSLFIWHNYDTCQFSKRGEQSFILTFALRRCESHLFTGHSQALKPRNKDPSFSASAPAALPGFSASTPAVLPGFSASALPSSLASQPQPLPSSLVTQPQPCHPPWLLSPCCARWLLTSAPPSSLAAPRPENDCLHKWSTWEQKSNSDRWRALGELAEKCG